MAAAREATFGEHDNDISGFDSLHNLTNRVDVGAEHFLRNCVKWPQKLANLRMHEKMVAHYVSRANRQKPNSDEQEVEVRGVAAQNDGRAFDLANFVEFVFGLEFRPEINPHEEVEESV